MQATPNYDALPGRLELPTLRLTASRSNQLSYGSNCVSQACATIIERILWNMTKNKSGAFVRRFVRMTLPPSGGASTVRVRLRKRLVRTTVRPSHGSSKIRLGTHDVQPRDERVNSALHVRSCTESSVCARPKHSHPRERVTSALLLRCLEACGRENAPPITKVIGKVGGVGRHYALAVLFFRDVTSLERQYARPRHYTCVRFAKFMVWERTTHCQRGARTTVRTTHVVVHEAKALERNTRTDA